MFTGIIESMGSIAEAKIVGGDSRMLIKAPAGYLDGAQLGDRPWRAHDLHADSPDVEDGRREGDSGDWAAYVGDHRAAAFSIAS